MLAAVRLLVLEGKVEDFEVAADPWRLFRAALSDHHDAIAAFVAEQPVQTNEVQRCFALLPVFLTVARAAGGVLDLLELGASAGLNLLWDRYRYRYRAGAWGAESALELTGEERVPVPGELLATRVTIRRRRGVDLQPVDVADEAGLRLLLSFVGDAAVRARLVRAAAVVRSQPPELIRGNYLELLPELLAERDAGAVTVVFQTLSTVYLTDDQRHELRLLVDDAGRAAPLAWISTPTPEEHGERRGDYPLELALWPGGERRTVARMDVRGETLEWIG